METRKLTPVGATAGGMLAGVVGTLAMDLLWFRRYRRGGGEGGFLGWEFSSGLEGYEQAPAPAQVGKRLVEGLLQTELEPRTAPLVNNVVHWSTGVAWGTLHGLLVGSLRERRASYGLATGTIAWAASYAALAPAKLYEPIWKYPVSTLRKDLGAHLVYGLGTAAAFRLLAGRHTS